MEDIIKLKAVKNIEIRHKLKTLTSLKSNEKQSDSTTNDVF